MTTANLKIGYNSRGEYSSVTADYKILDTVTVTNGSEVKLYEIISPAYPGSVPAGTAVTNPTYYRQIGGGAVGAVGADSVMTVSHIAGQTIGTGAKTFTFTETSNLGFAIGQRVRASNAPTVYMEGIITSFTTTTMNVTVDRTMGSGTLSGWTIGVAGDVGATGATGPIGPTGATGATGPKGDIGSAGLTATMAVTSTTSIALGTGSKTLTFSSVPNLGWALGTRLRVYNSSTQYMEGVVTSFLATTVTLTVDRFVGTGTFASWFISIAGDKGIDGLSITSTTYLNGVLTITTS